MKKRVIVCLMVAVFVCSLSSCGQTQQKPAAQKVTNQVTEKKVVTPQDTPKAKPTIPTNAFKEKRLWFINNGWDVDNQKSYHQLISCNTNLKDVVVHMDTEDFMKLSYDKEDDEQIKLYGGKGKFEPRTIDLQGITSDKRYIAFSTIYNGVQTDSRQLVYKGDKNWHLNDILKFAFTIYNTEKKQIVFRKQKYITYYNNTIHQNSSLISEPGSLIFPLYIEGDKFYLLEQIKNNELYYIDSLVEDKKYYNESNLFFESPFAEAKVIQFSFSDHSTKYINPNYRIDPWVTFNLQDTGVIGFSNPEIVPYNGHYHLQSYGGFDPNCVIKNIVDINTNKKIDVVEVNSKLIQDKYDIFDARLLSVLKVKDNPVALYSVCLNKRRQTSEIPSAHGGESSTYRDVRDKYQLYSITFDNKICQLNFDNTYQSFIFIRSNALINGKNFFYIYRPTIQDENNKVTNEEEFVIASFDGEKIEMKKLKPDKILMDFKYDGNRSFFYQ